MTKASKILLTVAGVLSIISFVLYVVFTVIFFIGSTANGQQEILKALNDGTFTYTIEGKSNAEVAEVLSAACRVLGVVFVIAAVFTVANIVICFVGAKKQTKGLLILNIVFGALSGVLLNVLGGIFGLVGNARE